MNIVNMNIHNELLLLWLQHLTKSGKTHCSIFLGTEQEVENLLCYKVCLDFYANILSLNFFPPFSLMIQLDIYILI